MWRAHGLARDDWDFADQAFAMRALVGGFFALATGTEDPPAGRRAVFEAGVRALLYPPDQAGDLRDELLPTQIEEATRRLLGAEDRTPDRPGLSPAVGANADLRVEQGDEGAEVAVLAGVLEGGDDAAMPMGTDGAAPIAVETSPGRGGEPAAGIGVRPTCRRSRCACPAPSRADARRSHSADAARPRSW
ncbi:hypothetical protein FH608_044115 [Nonomuraea phyllanthi]|uniref:Uncharacterized protein n=1 Tax=Nonomuraea phyllanthi TaxID=2219224 RepID=A0A5C4VFD0_9ACTN|nr:hypothetical protein [Nonomuraea phyllanthi]KAB8188428.1 hypothetical protein FH608_044115 [Nonomuraea phyllanthi]